MVTLFFLILSNISDILLLNSSKILYILIIFSFIISITHFEFILIVILSLNSSKIKLKNMIYWKILSINQINNFYIQFF